MELLKIVKCVKKFLSVLFRLFSYIANVSFFSIFRLPPNLDKTVVNYTKHWGGRQSLHESFSSHVAALTTVVVSFNFYNL